MLIILFLFCSRVLNVYSFEIRVEPCSLKEVEDILYEIMEDNEDGICNPCTKWFDRHLFFADNYYQNVGRDEEDHPITINRAICDRKERKQKVLEMKEIVRCALIANLVSLKIVQHFKGINLERNDEKGFYYFGSGTELIDEKKTDLLDLELPFEEFLDVHKKSSCKQKPDRGFHFYEFQMEKLRPSLVSMPIIDVQAEYIRFKKM